MIVIDFRIELNTLVPVTTMIAILNLLFFIIIHQMNTQLLTFAGASVVAESLVTAAFHRSRDTNARTPFGRHAKMNGYVPQYVVFTKRQIIDTIFQTV